MTYTSPSSSSRQPVQGELFAGVDQESPTDTPETKADTPRRPDQNQPTGGLQGSQFVPKKASDALKAALGIQTLDEQLEEMLRNSTAHNIPGGVAIDLRDGDKLSTINATSSSIGVAAGAEMSANDAKAIIAIAKSSGWPQVVPGKYATEEQKDMLWLEAQRQGMHMKGYEPDPDSPAARKWRTEQTAGVSQADNKDYHLETMKLLKEKSDAEQDPAMKAGLQKMLNRFTEGAVLGNANTFAALTEALSDKHPGRAGFNLAVDAVTKLDPNVGVAKLEEPAAGTSGARLNTPKAPTARMG